MTRSIAGILERAGDNISIEELMMCAEAAMGNGDIVLIKLDGARERDHYTTMITSSSNAFEMIRADKASLKEALLEMFRKYVEVRKPEKQKPKFWRR